jgi:uncharacterized membrane protein
MITAHTSGWHELKAYIGHIRQFTRRDWWIYGLWIGTILGLFVSTALFLGWGASHGMVYPAYVWSIPVGALIFTGAIAIDTIGHRTVYQAELQKYEALVHHITIFSGVTSVILLCAAYRYPVALYVPTLVLIGLSIFYSAVDEAIHWFRYARQQSDRVEMWSHYFILLGHLMMISAWWLWYRAGYPGVADTLRTFGL